jgi:hypothetical protein
VKGRFGLDFVFERKIFEGNNRIHDVMLLIVILLTIYLFGNYKSARKNAEKTRAFSGAKVISEEV